MTMNEDTRRQPIQADRGRGRAVRRQNGGRSSLNDAVEAVLRCQGCDHSEECALWLKRADVATAPPPDHCTNPRLIRRLQEAHG